jgi:hypothetical protein
MPKQIVPNAFKTHLLTQLVESITEVANTSYYAFIGDHVADGDTLEDVVQPVGSRRQLVTEPFRNMILGKKIQENDVRLIVKRYDWTSGTVYAMYDDQDSRLDQKKYFVVVDEIAFRHVYKCIFNAGGAPSTARPVFADVAYDAALFETGDNYYETSDGYQWKYMYSIDSDTFKKFSSAAYMPVVANTTVSENAINGSIDVIKIDSGGKNYNNYLSSQFNASQIQFSNTSTYLLPTTASDVTNFYANTIIHLTGGTGSGQFKRITNSTSISGVGVRITIRGVDNSDTNTFAVTPDETTTYEISPQILIESSGEQTVNAFARAIINANASNSIYRAEILNPGKNYRYATTEVLKGVPADNNNRSVGVAVVPVDAITRPILPPSGGHGANAAVELASTALSFTTTFRRSEANTVSAENTFGTFGLIRDPLFANVEINHQKVSIDSTPGSDGTFIAGEKVYQIKKIKVSGNVSVNNSNNIVTGNLGDCDYDAFFKSGDFVYVTSDENPQYNFISTISSVANSSVIRLTDNVIFTSNNASLYYAIVTANGVVNEVSTTSRLYLRDADDGFAIGDIIIGANTYSVANVSGIDTNERFGTSNSSFTFQTFNQMTRCFGEITGTFQNDEQVYQGNTVATATATARVHSSNSTSISLTLVEGELNTNITIKGATSQAILGGPGAVKFTKYSGDLDPTKGNIIYLQNDVPVERFESQSEEVRVILEF